jgi:CheY-like chemotaxis protein
VLPPIPGLVILDGGPDSKDCDSVIAGVVALRRASGKNLPAVILLSNRAADPASFSGIVDAVVTKPFTADQLQPVVDRLMQKAKE